MNSSSFGARLFRERLLLHSVRVGANRWTECSQHGLPKGS